MFPLETRLGDPCWYKDSHLPVHRKLHFSGKTRNLNESWILADDLFSATTVCSIRSQSYDDLVDDRSLFRSI